jgi:hypothetical protein
VQNGGETGVDCGGTDGINVCGGCIGDTCSINTDCHLLHCDGTGHCAAM